MTKVYTKVGSNMDVSEDIKTTYSLSSLEEKKSSIESILSRAQSQYDAEVALYQPQLDEVNTLISEATKLGITK